MPAPTALTAPLLADNGQLVQGTAGEVIVGLTAAAIHLVARFPCVGVDTAGEFPLELVP